MKLKVMNTIEDAQRQYISEWHDDFVNYIGGLWSIVEAMMNHPSATENDKKGFDRIKLLLHGKDAVEIERRLANADVKQDILDKIEKLDKDLLDIAIEHLETDIVVKDFLKKLSYHQIEYNKRLAEIRLNNLQLLK